MFKILMTPSAKRRSGNSFLTTEVFNDVLTIIGAPLQRNGRAVKIAVKNQILTTHAFCARVSNIFNDATFAVKKRTKIDLPLFGELGQTSQDRAFI